MFILWSMLGGYIYLVVHVRRFVFILWSMLGGYVYLVVHVKRLRLSCGPC